MNITTIRVTMDVRNDVDRITSMLNELIIQALGHKPKKRKVTFNDAIKYILKPTYFDELMKEFITNNEDIQDKLQDIKKKFREQLEKYRK